MAEKWFLSDTHFFHGNILTFETGRNRYAREFADVYEMNERIVENWNKYVRPQDKVYHLGDVTFRYDGVFNELMSRLNGHKRLYLGNHDKLQNGSLQRWFEKVELWSGGKFKKDGFVASHIPLRPDQMRDGELNVHGHVHWNSVRDQFGDFDSRYYNVCVEQTNYCPVHIDEIIKRVRR